MDIADLGFSVDSSGIVKGEKSLDRLADAGERVAKKSKSVEILFKGLKAGSAAVSAALATGVFKYKEYGTALAEVNTLLDSSWPTGSLEAMGQEVRKLSKQLGGNIVDNTNALYQVISAGASNSTDAIKTLTQANKLSLGGVASLEGSVDGLTSSMNAYAGSGLSAEQASDSMFVAVKRGKTTIEELSGVMGSVAPIASQLGVEFDDLNAAIATITTTGSSTSEAATGLAGVLKAVIKPTKEATDEAKRLGIEFDATAIKSLGLAGFIEQVAEKSGGSSVVLGRLFGEIEGLKAVMQLGGAQASTYAAILESMGLKAGATDEAVKKMTTGTARLGFEWEKAKRKVSDALVIVGEKASVWILKGIDNLDLITQALVTTGKAVTVFGATFGAIKLLGPILLSTTAKTLAMAAAVQKFGLALVGLNLKIAATELLVTGLKGAFALLGGPLGIALAVAGIYAFVTSASAAEKQNRSLKNELGLLATQGFDPATAATKELKNEMLELNVITANNRLNDLTDSFSSNKSTIEEVTAKIQKYREALAGDWLSPGQSKRFASDLSLYTKNLELLRTKQKQLNVEIGQGEKQLKDAEFALLGLEEVTVTATKKTNLLTSAFESNQGQVKRTKNAYQQFYQGINLTIDKVKELTEVFGEYGSAATEVDAILFKNQKSTFRLKSIQEDLNRRLEAGEISSKAYKEALEAAGISTDNLANKSVSASSLMLEGLKKFQNSVQDSFFNLFRSGSNFFSNLKDTAFDILGQIAAKITTTFAIDKFSSLLNGTKLGDIFGVTGGGGGGLNVSSIVSGLGSLFSGGSSAAVAGSAIGGSLGGSIGLGSAAATTTSAFSITGALKAVGTAVKGLSSGVATAIGAIPVWGQIALGIGALATVFKSGARSPLQLGLDQLQEVDDATRAGRNAQVQLGSTAGVATSFLGGKDENSVFFGVDLAQQELQRVGDIFKRITGANQALALKDGIIRIEDFNRRFSDSHETVVAQLKASIAEYKLGFTQVERSSLSSLGNMLTELDNIFDRSADSGLSNAERLTSAYSQAFGVTTEEANKALNNIGISSDRIAEIFTNTSDDTLNHLVGISNTGSRVFSEIRTNGLLAANDIQSQFNVSSNSIAANLQGLAVSGSRSAQDIGSSFRANLSGLGDLVNTQLSEARRNADALINDAREQTEKLDEIASGIEKMRKSVESADKSNQQSSKSVQREVKNTRVSAGAARIGI